MPAAPVPPTGRLAAATIPLAPPVPPTAPVPPSAPLKPGAPAMPAAPLTPMGQPTVAMPTATVPLSRPGAMKPAGFTKPAGFNKTNVQDTNDEDSEGKENPVLLVLSIIAAVLALAFCLIQFNTDRILDRAAHDQRVFGTPSASSDEGDPAAESSESVDEGFEEE